MGWLDKLLFWRRDDAPDPEFGVEGCFTQPGAELDGDAPVEASAGEAPLPHD